MCDAAVSTCSCSTDGSAALTFGEAIENAERVEAGFKEVLLLHRCVIILQSVCGGSGTASEVCLTVERASVSPDVLHSQCGSNSAPEHISGSSVRQHSHDPLQIQLSPTAHFCQMLYRC
jgi:hypothetical protein